MERLNLFRSWRKTELNAGLFRGTDRRNRTGKNLLLGLTIGLLMGLGATACLRQRFLNSLDQVGCNLALPDYAMVFYLEMPLIELIAPEKGEKIAYVGASDGGRAVRTALIVDSLDLYIQDIDTVCLNQQHLDDLIAYYAPMSPTSLVGQFHLVVGTETQTHLPRGEMDKVVLAHTLHHFSDPVSMLRDIRESLVPRGLLFIVEHYAAYPDELDSTICDLPMLDRDQIECRVGGAGFELVEGPISMLGNWVYIYERGI